MKRLIICSVGICAAFGMLRPASAELVDYTVEHGVESNFAFSLLHYPKNENGNGTPVYWVDGTFRLDVQEEEFSFVDVDWTVYEFTQFGDNNVDSLPVVGSASLNESSPNAFKIDPGNGRPDGTLSIDLDLDGVGTGTAIFEFLPQHYVGSVNSFDGESLYLWGATTSLSGFDGWGDNVSGLGLDQKGLAVPEPAVVGLLSSGLIAPAFRRRRRTT